MITSKKTSRPRASKLARPSGPARHPVPAHVLRSFTPARHDHRRCVSAALSKADATCNASGRRLTPLRRRVLELVWRSHTPVKAYDLLAALGREREQAAPPTVYRALDFLLEAGLVHRIASLNAFVGCGEPGPGHTGQFLICTACGTVAELDEPALSKTIAASAERLGFEVRRETIEIAGLCAGCRRRGAD
ncbi:MAG: transcriptional repressor [Gammaproteobacteria bacterium]|nr:transcriptional repressor [Gammaproteobacteria bacterium]